VSGYALLTGFIAALRGVMFSLDSRAFRASV
jgi:hypothetical protein